MNWLEVLGIIPAIVAMVKDLVKEFETPGASGPDKKNAVLAVVKAGLDALGQMGVKAPATIVLTVADYVIDAVVAGFNLVGVFTKKAAGAVAPVTGQKLS